METHWALDPDNPVGTAQWALCGVEWTMAVSVGAPRAQVGLVRSGANGSGAAAAAPHKDINWTGVMTAGLFGMILGVMAAALVTGSIGRSVPNDGITGLIGLVGGGGTMAGLAWWAQT